MKLRKAVHNLLTFSLRFVFFLGTGAKGLLLTLNIEQGKGLTVSPIVSSLFDFDDCFSPAG